MSCNVTTQGQENVCTTCGVRWDLSDLDAPECGERELSRTEISDRLRKYLKTFDTGLDGTARP